MCNKINYNKLKNQYVISYRAYKSLHKLVENLYFIAGVRIYCSTTKVAVLLLFYLVLVYFVAHARAPLITSLLPPVDLPVARRYQSSSRSGA